MGLPIVIAILVLVTASLFMLFYVKSTLGSDQSVHLLFISLIRENRHRMINQCKAFMIQPNMIYPQLLHWIFSFLPMKSLSLVSSILPMISALLSLSAFLFFLNFLSPYYQFDTMAMLTMGLIFVTTPFTYNINNAKNAGISARGLGLFLGQLYTYCMILYALSGNYLFILVGAVAGLLIFMSSQFASQYLLFGCVILTALYGSFIPVATVAASVILYFAISPVIARQFFVGNLGHKKFYYKFLADKLLLTYRESIWKDVFYEIWRLIFTRQSPKGGGTTFMYVYNNPFVALVTGMPLAVIVILLVFYNAIATDEFIKGVVWIMCAPVVCGMILFFLTSLKKTRFLGEPERYVEFSIGPAAFLAGLFIFELQSFGSNGYLILSIILGYQILMVLFQAFVARKRSKMKARGIVESVRVINDSIEQETDKEKTVKLLSNNTEIMRSLITAQRQVFYPSLYSSWYGKFHYPDLYNTFDEMKSEMIIPVVREFAINHFVLDTNFLTQKNFEASCRKESLPVTVIASHGNLISYKIS